MAPQDERFAGHLYPQVIPEPDEVQPGAPAPWATWAAARRSGFTRDVVQSALRRAGRDLASSSPPDQPGELALVADAWPAPITRRSAVLVALFEEEDECHLVFTRRAFSLRHHRGEIAFPGGRANENETLIDTALREAREEVGLDPSTVSAVAWLNPIATFASRSSIWPIVGFLPGRPTIRIDPVEVDRAFTVALRDLMHDDVFVEERWRRNAQRPGFGERAFFPVYFFRVPGDVIWGATARVLTELLCLVSGAPWSEDGGRGEVTS